MTVLPVHPRKAEYSILEVALPGRAPADYGVLLLDPETDTLHVRLRDDVRELAGEEDAEVLEALAADLASKAREMGGQRVLALLEDTLSNVLRLGERETAAVRDFPLALERLFERRVLGRAAAPAKVLPFVTHLPVYSLRAAAGRFGEDHEVDAESWVATPEGLRLTRDMYAIHVTGRSMEPEIPDGSLAVFRYAPAGSRQGKRVLVWRRGSSQAGGEFTVKVYESQKQVGEAGWLHTRILLKPLNPEYEALELDEDSEYRILGEFVCVIPAEQVLG